MIDAVTVSVGYADFLAETLPVNLPMLNRLVVVTSRDDHETQAVCRKYSVECRVTDIMHHRGARFAKARAIDYGLAFLSSENWILHFDSDIAFPPNMLSALRMRPMDEKCLYGVDRVNCDSWDEWVKYKQGNRWQHTRHCMVQAPGFKAGSFGTRIAIDAYGGYVPIGFFQLWHASTNRRYPLTQRDGAEHGDVLHAIQWEPHERHLISEFFVVHLNSQSSNRMGTNWQGRKTPPFGPGEISKGEPSKHEEHPHHRHHRHKKHGNYCDF